MGKSTAFNILSGSIIPNLGDFEADEVWWEDVISSLPRGELRDFLVDVSESDVTVALKPQYVDPYQRQSKAKLDNCSHL